MIKGKHNNFDKLMNLLVVTIIEKRFLRTNKTHTIYILYTPFKYRVYKVNSTYEKFPYKIGDNIEDVKKWCDDNKHQYRKRKGKSNIWDS